MAKSNTKTLIIGNGEIGKALFRVFSIHYSVRTIDKDESIDETFDIIHICFPYFEGFVGEVKRYQAKYKPQHTIIHSTVPVGTSRLCGAIHSPIKGIHPYLEEGIRTFTKFLGGEKASEVADYFRRAGLKVYITDNPENTELIKIDSTNWYGVCIEKTKDTKELCNEYGVPFELFTLWTEDYNAGYEKLGHPEYKRPNLVPIMTDIKGHCVKSNSKFLETKFTKLI